MTKLHNMRVIRIPPFRAVSSGIKTFEGLFAPDGFDAWIDAHRHLIRDLLYAPADFLWHVGKRETWGRGENIWIYAVNDFVTGQDTAPYPLIEFPGGLYLAATADENDPEDLQETIAGMFRWIDESPVFQYGDFPESGMCNMPGKGADELFGVAQQQIFLPLKTREE